VAGEISAPFVEAGYTGSYNNASLSPSFIPLIPKTKHESVPNKKIQNTPLLKVSRSASMKPLNALVPLRATSLATQSQDKEVKLKVVLYGATGKAGSVILNELVDGV
jgi:hypothetical protein